MRRIGRYILNGLTMLSLVLCVGGIALWCSDGGWVFVLNRWQRPSSWYGPRTAIDFAWWLSDRGSVEWYWTLPGLEDRRARPGMADLLIEQLARSAHARACDQHPECPICSYDLRATPDRCPECGMIPTKVKA